MRSVILTVMLLIASGPGAAYGFDYVRYDEDAFAISLPSGFTLSKEGDYPRLFTWTDDYMGRTFVSVNWAEVANLTADEVKQAYESLLGVESDLSAQKTIVSDTKLVAYGADDGLRGRYDAPGENEEMRYRVTFLQRGDRVYTFVIATPLAFEEGILEVVNEIESSVVLRGGDG